MEKKLACSILQIGGAFTVLLGACLTISSMFTLIATRKAMNGIGESAMESVLVYGIYGNASIIFCGFVFYCLAPVFALGIARREPT